MFHFSGKIKRAPQFVQFLPNAGPPNQCNHENCRNQVSLGFLPGGNQASSSPGAFFPQGQFSPGTWMGPHNNFWPWVQAHAGFFAQPVNPRARPGFVTQPANPPAEAGLVAQPINPQARPGFVAQSVNPQARPGFNAQPVNRQAVTGFVAQSVKPQIQAQRVDVTPSVVVEPSSSVVHSIHPVSSSATTTTSTTVVTTATALSKTRNFDEDLSDDDTRG